MLKRRCLWRNPPRQAQRAFSLIELMIVVAIMGLIIAMGIPGFTDWVQNSKIRTEAESILSGLQATRSEAVRRNARVEFRLTGAIGGNGTTGWQIWDVTADAEIKSRAAGVENANAVKVSVLPANATRITYDGTGRTPLAGVNADASAFLTQIDIDSIMLPAADSRDLRIILGVGGTARLCDPNVPTGSTSTDPRKCS